METKGDRVFSSVVPENWAYRKIDLDYGLDREIEIVVNEELTGKTLLVQLKSSYSFQVGTSVIKYRFETDKLQYYLQRDIPVILVLVDLGRELCYWLFVQEYIYEKLDKTNLHWRKQKTVVLQIPIANVWSESTEAIRQIAYGGPFYLMIQNLANLPLETVLNWRTNPESISFLENFKKQMKLKDSQVDLHLAQRYSIEGMDEESLSRLESIYRRKDTPPRIRLDTIAALLWYYVPTDKSQNYALFQLCHEGVKLTDATGNSSYGSYFRGVALQTVFFKIVNDLSDQLLLRRVSQQSKSGYEFILDMFAVETWGKLNELVQEYVGNLKKVQIAKHPAVFVDLLRRYAIMNLFLYGSFVLWVDGIQLKALLESAETHLELATKIADYMQWKSLKCILLLDFAWLHNYRNDVEKRRAVLKECGEIAKAMGHKGLMNQAERKYEFYEKRGRFITGPEDIPKSDERSFEQMSDEEIDRMHRMLLEAGGIDINGNDELARLARIGLRDRNPERILRHCDHLYVEVLTYGPIWNMVGLKTTGTKLLYCEKKECFDHGWRLDDILAGFKREHCSDCVHHSPGPKEWKWTYRWQRERESPPRMKLILRNLRGIGRPKKEEEQ